MTALPSWPDHLLTLDEFAALPEDNTRRYELQEGILIVTPRPVALHQRVLFQLLTQLDAQLPVDWEPVGEFEVITRHRSPSSVRVPDIVVVPTEAVDDNLARVEGADVLLAVEIVSPGSHLTDTVTKPAEYATVGIQHYWVIDLESPISLTAYHLAGEFGYQEAPAVTGTFTTSEPFPLTIDLPALLTRRGRTERTVEQ
ncbi:Uma2 family endonuclease [Kutzneria kofuensis]|uniref:Uma2 family endonuclease n=1 Tax=Kutzneria kofuensis TaxID=103725 RepID=A0A7W9KAJ1_9PSEU|nr:Uma2 family endonuclease [Kutzneria kofuensis]MBB5888926.1 Uma2 family endonuclease [Kutzneria kofuensis]